MIEEYTWEQKNRMVEFAEAEMYKKQIRLEIVTEALVDINDLLDILADRDMEDTDVFNLACNVEMNLSEIFNNYL